VVFCNSRLGFGEGAREAYRIRSSQGEIVEGVERLNSENEIEEVGVRRSGQATCGEAQGGVGGDRRSQQGDTPRQKIIRNKLI
jgi:hypothetical protein